MVGVELGVGLHFLSVADGGELTLLEDAAKRQGQYLGSLLEVASPGAREAAAALLHTVEAAVELREQLTSDRVPFTVNLLSALSDTDRILLIDEAAPGFGRADAPVIVMGTEQAFRINDALSLAVHNCALTALRLCESRPGVLAAIAARPDWATRHVPRPFHEYPNGYWDQKPRPGETSTALTMLLCWSANRRTAAEELPRLGDHAYQLDLSARPALRVADGLPPKPSRAAALLAEMDSLRATARVLLLHGTSISPDEPVVSSLIQRFTGVSAAALVWQRSDEPRARLQWAKPQPDRIVLLTRALNSDVSDTYIAKVRSLLRPFLA